MDITEQNLDEKEGHNNGQYINWQFNKKGHKNSFKILVCKD